MIHCGRRVHMYLEEAKHQLEEKNTAVDKLRGQLQIFLGGAKRGIAQLNDDAPALMALTSLEEEAAQCG
ncbi:hypothetical protein LINPERHAP1_LOCUS15605, partial [Linum perenne]